MVQNDLILDFNLYLCKKFGYRSSCSVMENTNGFCVNVSEHDLDSTSALGSTSKVWGNFPDLCIIMERNNFKKDQERFDSFL